MQICFIDDREENREGWLKGFGPEVSTECDLRIFASATDWYHWLNNGNKPDVVFLDFFIGDTYGSELIEDLKSRFTKDVFIVAHSSMTEANAGMIEVGADAMLPKVKLKVPSPTIRDTFSSMADLKSFLHRK